MQDDRQRRHDELADRIKACTRCNGLNEVGKTQAAPGYGSVRSRVVIVGQSLCGPCMAKQEPFYGGSGKHLDRAFARAQIDKIDLYITNVVHCHPPNNRASLPQEVANCAPYLSAELDIVRPRLAIGLGDDAKAALRENYPTSPQLDWPLLTIDGLEPGVPGRPVLLFPRHPGSFRWIRKELRDDMTEQWVDCLARALRWA